MKLDRTFVRDVRKIANGDGSREAKFAFKKKVEEAKKGLSTPDVRDKYGDCIQKYGRVPVAICTAVTIIERQDRLEARTVRWATKVLTLWTNRSFSDLLFAYISDNLKLSISVDRLISRIQGISWQRAKSHKSAAV